ncbi:MAG: hypothetical protein GF365_02950 [Candidatus Buchananbacteria bacterium]|nr:hypothetical protein [Candidatus Buchananbacteria bacterium]
MSDCRPDDPMVNVIVKEDGEEIYRKIVYADEEVGHLFSFNEMQAIARQEKQLLLNGKPVNYQTLIGCFGDNCEVELITIKKG